MDPHLSVWIATIVVIGGLLAFDFFFHVRKAHIPTIHEAAVWSAIYIGLAIVFGIVLWVMGDTRQGRSTSLAMCSRRRSVSTICSSS